LEPCSKVVMEASSTWQYLYDYLEQKGFDMTLANPLEVKAIASAKVKTDKVDAEMLAHLLRANLIPECYVPPQYVRDERQVARLRASLVEVRTQVKNKVHAILSRNGVKHEFSDLFGKSGVSFLETLELPPASRFELDEYLTLLLVLDDRVDSVQKQVEVMAEDNYGARLLMTIPGVSHYSALMIMSEIGDFTRFPDAKHLCAYAGLVPSVYQSGKTRRTGHITKRGSRWLRWISIQCANRAVQSNNALRSFFSELEQSKGHQVARSSRPLVMIGKALRNRLVIVCSNARIDECRNRFADEFVKYNRGFS
ncbi:IS110 family transposase, partial [Candidatus Micrarchaeota archaeon]|nr:IS110 family transposase [Candidatus Micrarchaeota archaeon]